MGLVLSVTLNGRSADCPMIAVKLVCHNCENMSDYNRLGRFVCMNCGKVYLFLDKTSVGW